MNKVTSYYDEVAHLLLDCQPDWNGINELDGEEKFNAGVAIAVTCMKTYYYMNDKTPAKNYALQYGIRSGTRYEIHPNEKAPHLEFLDHLISQSVHDKSSWDSLIFISIDLLRIGKPLPTELSMWLADVAEDILKQKEEQERPRPTRRGRYKVDLAVRNEAIRVAANELVSHGWNLSRYEVQNGIRYDMCCVEGGSAADVVGIAHFELCEETLMYKTVEGILRSPAGKPEI